MLDRWYVAQSRPGRTRIALENLRRQGFETYYPMATVERIRRGRICREPEPLFPRYILIFMNLSGDNWRSVNGTRGIIRLVGCGPEGAPSAVRVGEVERLQELERSKKLFISEVLRMKRGDLVRVKVGPGVDQIGTVIRTRGERVEFLLRLLGREIRATAPMHHLDVVPG